MNKLNIIYRISDKSQIKNKLPNAGKKECLLNTIKEKKIIMVLMIY